MSPRTDVFNCMLTKGHCYDTAESRRLSLAFAIFFLVRTEVENSENDAEGEKYNNYNDTNNDSYVDPRVIRD
jgi:hypothetical protein